MFTQDKRKMQGDNLARFRYLKGCPIGGAELFRVAPEVKQQYVSSKFWVENQEKFLMLRVVQQ